MGKYKRDKGLQIPMEQRQKLNAKILYLVENHEAELYGITPEDIFNVYMGNGGLHGLDRKDFQNFHAYTEAKKEIEQGQFFTPAEICEFLVACVKPEPKDIIYDLTYGKGDFFNYLPTESNIYGTEIDMKAVKIAQYLYPKANLQYGDIRQYSPVLSGDIVFGNPPFHLEWGTKEAPVSSQMYYCKKAYQVLKNGGLLVLLVSESFLSDDFSNKGDIEEINHMFNLIVQFSLPADAFKEYGVTSFRTKAMILQKKSQYVTERPYTTELEVLKRPQEIYQTYVLPVLQERRKNAANIYFECQNTDLEAKQKQVFQEKTVKLLFDIKRNRNIAHKAGLAEAILQKYLKQTKPEELSWQEWEKIKIQPEDVLRKLKGILSSANMTYRNEIRVVKTTYGFKEKDYRENGTDMNLGSINSFVLSKREVPGFEQFLKKKRREFALQETPFEKMKQDDKIAEYLENWHVTSQMTGEVKYLNAVQKKEVNKLLQKRYVALQFSMGTGKSLCTLAMAQYRMKYNPVRNIFIVGTALAINNTYEYDSNEVPTKVKKAIRLLQMWKYEKVAIGVRRIEVADSYYRYLKQAFPERQIFYITGDKVPCKQRQRIVEKLRKTENGILLSTQQSLSESMNIDDVDKIILPELHYNHAAMEQYYFRFIRYTSRNFKQVVFLIYENSIEVNLLKMILAKEKINLFMKNQLLENGELYERFGINPQIFSLLMTTSVDQEGKLQIQWGEQKIS